MAELEIVRIENYSIGYLNKKLFFIHLLSTWLFFFIFIHYFVFYDHLLFIIWDLFIHYILFIIIIIWLFLIHYSIIRHLLFLIIVFNSNVSLII